MAMQVDQIASMLALPETFSVESPQHCAILVPLVFISRVDISHLMAPHLALCGDLRNDPYN